MKKLKKHTSMPGLLKRARTVFEKLPDTIARRSKISLADCLMAGLALFGLKCPSLLDFDETCREEAIHLNLKHLYGIKQVPCDTYMREQLDEIETEKISRAFNRIQAAAQRQKLWERYDYIDTYKLVSLDGTGCFSSPKVHCANCCVKAHKNGSCTYYHQVLGMVMVHPDEKVVLPFAPEPILKEDGAGKNDCERNAAKRGLTRLRREHPRLKAIILEDGLGSNGPHLRLLQALDFRFIVGVKPKDHGFLFEFVEAVKAEEKEERGKALRGKKDVLHRYRWVNQVPLNDANEDLQVNFLEYWELSLTGKVQQHFSWVTDFTLASNNVEKIMRGGRARWKIENETFNTLKNKGYQFEHNFGHGYKQLSTVLALLMFLAFLIDQIQEATCPSFQSALKKMKRKCRLWDKLRNLFHVCILRSWQDVYDAIIYGHVVTVLQPNTS